MKTTIATLLSSIELGPMLQWIVDVATEELTIEISGQERKVEAFIDLMRPFGIIELVRTGRIAMVRTINRRNGDGGVRVRTADAS